MPKYDLYLESGPKKKKTMVHVPELLGCVATGGTTESALAATPDAIRAFLRLLQRHGESVDPDQPIELSIVEHITEGDWLGNGSPFIILATDMTPLTEEDLETHLQHVTWISGELSDWAANLSPEQMDARPEHGRPNRAVLLHVLGAGGSYLSTSLGGVKGFSALHGAAERGELDLALALRRMAEMICDAARSATAEQRAAVHQLPSGPKTFTKAIRRILEHQWEHLEELSQRAGGPRL